jgi:hypothetical protein
MRSDAFIVIGMFAGSVVAAGCAIVGYDLEGYKPAQGGANAGGGGSGGAGISSTQSSASSGGNGGGACGAGEACTETPPNGFQGPVALLVDQPGQKCAGDFPNEAFIGGGSPEGDAATCSCTCDTAPCAANLIVTTYSDPSCTLATAGYGISKTDGCNMVAPTGAADVIVTAPKATGACTPSAPTVHTTPPSFGTTVVACGGASRGAACGSGEACFPKPKSPFAAELCIYRSGDVACPAGLTKKVYFKTLDDTRGCTACACGPAALTCSTTVSFFSDPACAASVGNAASGVCTALAAPWNSADAKVASPCAPINGMPDGKVSGAEPTTFCCD